MQTHGSEATTSVQVWGSRIVQGEIQILGTGQYERHCSLRGTCANFQYLALNVLALRNNP